MFWPVRTDGDFTGRVVQIVSRDAERRFCGLERRLTSHFLAAEPGIRIEMEHIENAVNRRSNRSASDRELSDWAAMLLMNDAYDWEGPDEDEISESLNELIAPKAEQDDDR